MLCRMATPEPSGSAASSTQLPVTLQELLIHCTGRVSAAMPFVKMVFCRKNPIPLATLFNSPLFQPLVSVRETAGGEALHAELMTFVEEKAKSLGKYQGK